MQIIVLQVGPPSNFTRLSSTPLFSSSVLLKIRSCNLLIFDQTNLFCLLSPQHFRSRLCLRLGYSALLLIPSNALQGITFFLYWCKSYIHPGLSNVPLLGSSPSSVAFYNKRIVDRNDCRVITHCFHSTYPLLFKDFFPT